MDIFAPYGNYMLNFLGLYAWKKLQRWVYLAGIMAFVHWALLGLAGNHESMGGALFHFSPVMLLQIYRVWKQNLYHKIFK